MAREEQINQVAEKAADEVYTYTFQGWDDLVGLFKEGVKWSDENPKEGLIDIDKACEWLKSNLYNYAGEDDKRNIVPFDNAIFHDFKKAMEE